MTEIGLPHARPASPLPYTVDRHAAMIAHCALALSGRHDQDAGLVTRCGDTCLPYHRGWLLLQHLGLISGLASERGYMAETIRLLAASRPLGSILIAGCADFGLLSVVHEALGTAVGRTRITVIDRCDTPLALCRHYAAEMGFEVAFRRHEILSLPPEGRYDLVLMHSLLSFCGAEDRCRLMNNLGLPLVPGGILLAYQSIRPGPAAVTLAYSSDEIETLVRRTRQECGAVIAALGLDSDCVDNHVRSFYRTKTTVSVPSVAGLIEGAEASGLALASARLLFDSRSGRHRPATPNSYYMKYEISFARAPC